MGTRSNLKRGMIRENACECCAVGLRTLSTRFHDESRVDGLLDSIHCCERDRERDKNRSCGFVCCNVTGRDVMVEIRVEIVETEGHGRRDPKKKTKLEESENQHRASNSSRERVRHGGALLLFRLGSPNERVYFFLFANDWGARLRLSGMGSLNVRKNKRCEQTYLTIVIAIQLRFLPLEHLSQMPKDHHHSPTVSLRPIAERGRCEQDY